MVSKRIGNQAARQPCVTQPLFLHRASTRRTASFIAAAKSFGYLYLLRGSSIGHALRHGDSMTNLP